MQTLSESRGYDRVRYAGEGAPATRWWPGRDTGHRRAQSHLTWCSMGRPDETDMRTRWRVFSCPSHRVSLWIINSGMIGPVTSSRTALAPSRGRIERAMSSGTQTLKAIWGR